MNNGDLISRKALEEALERTNIRLGFDKSRMFGLIEKAHAVDAVEVVRCRECKYYNVSRLECHNRRMNGVIGSDGYCSYGERRSE